MGLFKYLVIAILAISFFVFIIFFGRLPALRRTPIASLYKLICIHIPNAIFDLDQRLTSGRVTGSITGFGNFVMHDRHPTVVIIFLTIMLGGEYLYLPYIWSRLSILTQISVLITVVLPHLFLYLSCAADPGYITPENHAYYMSLYPYDHVMFHPGKECSTCGFLKPARSKHCSICKRCIAKADHHCIFINSCVGYGNHHWFLLLLTSTSWLTLYGGFLGVSVLSSDMHARFPEWTLWPKGLTFNKYMSIWGWGISRNPTFGATTLLAILCSPLVVGLTIYSFYLVYCGTSTNETLKWEDWKEDMTDGYAYQRDLSKTRRRDYKTEPLCVRWPVEPERILVMSMGGEAQLQAAPLAGYGEWKRVWSLRDVENLYDMGFWDNLCDVFVSDYTFGNGQGSRIGMKNQTFATRAKVQVAYPP